MNSNIPGFFPSIVKASSVVHAALRFNELRCNKNELYALISDPAKKGRTNIESLFEQKQLLSEDYNARSLVHEYGGGALHVNNESIFFINYEDQGVYCIENKEIRLIFKSKNLRFSDLALDFSEKFLYCIVEDHNKDPVENCIARINLLDNTLEIVHKVHDFYITPRISPNGKRLVWICWSHPNMVWDETYLYCADLEGNKIENIRILEKKEQVSIIEPQFNALNELYYVSDELGFWQIYHEKKGLINSKKADFGAPAWVLGISSYCFYNEKTIVGKFTQDGRDTLYSIDLDSNKLSEYNLEYTQIHQICSNSKDCFFLASSPTKAESIISFNLNTKNPQVIKASQEPLISSEWISKPEKISYESLDNKEGYAFYYPPKNPNINPNVSKKAPLIIKCHGGPTHHFCPVFSMEIQYFTSRGFAYVLLNYSGSTGYGRAYRDRLKKKWGIVDVFDAASCANSLVKKNLCDQNRLFIKGGSAGGYTTLAALAFSDVFSAGTSYYGVSDPKLLAEDTHKMEYHYLDSLIGPYPQEKENYNKVSPLVHVDKITVPVLLLQGDEDKVVPKEQSELIYKKLKNRNIKATYILFRGEQHGFRQKKNIQESLESELEFYQSI